MAVDEHVQRLLEGSNAWNRRRRDFPKVRPDLSFANLADADLSRAHLIDANLSGANLSRADLSRANLIDANLSGANLSRAYLIDANLSDADLIGANLTDANLRSANLDGARLLETVVGNTDLTGVDGLETCNFRGPSIIDFQTIKKSWPLPQVFLRGVGLPDAIIDYLPSLTGQPIQFYSCFISYSTKDKDFAQRLHADLQNKGVRCWFAPHDLPIGAKILDEIDAAIINDASAPQRALVPSLSLLRFSTLPGPAERRSASGGDCKMIEESRPTSSEIAVAGPNSLQKILR